MRRALFTLVMAASMLVATPAANATIIQYSANLSGLNEASPNASTGTGTALVIIDDLANTMQVNFSFSGLAGPTTAAHIHCCAIAPLNAGVATTTPTFPGFLSGVTSGTYNQLFDMTLASSYNPAFITSNGGVSGAETALFAGLAADSAYLNIHTTAYPGGEIRGFLTQITEPVPEPATLALMGLGLVGLGVTRRVKHA